MRGEEHEVGQVWGSSFGDTSAAAALGLGYTAGGVRWVDEVYLVRQ